VSPGRAGGSRAPVAGRGRRPRPGARPRSPGFMLGISPDRTSSTTPLPSKSQATQMLDRRT